MYLVLFTVRCRVTGLCPGAGGASALLNLTENDDYKTASTV